MATIYTCDFNKSVIFPSFNHEGKINQELVQIEPFFECPHVHELRKKGIAMPAQASVLPDGKMILWNKPINN